nr:EOG090X03YR [Eurycercus lamellatus]
MEPENADDVLIARGERWAPLGAAEPEEDSNFDFDDQDIYWQSYSGDSEKLRLMEEEQEQLNSSLMALTSHFAQVQFRLKQIVDAEPETKEVLLKELEEFAFRGIPDFQNPIRSVEGAQNTEEDHATKMESHRVKQHELIEKLKQQLEDLERYAYETGEAGLPQTLVVERQKIIIDQMKNKLQFNVDDLDKYTVEELRQQVDQAIGQDKVNQVFRRMTNLLQIYIISQFGCGVSTKFPRDMPSREKNKQMREALSRLNEAVLQVMRTSSTRGGNGRSSVSWESDNQVEIVKAVRKGLCPALRELLIHGMQDNSNTSSLVPFLSCAVPGASASTPSGCSAPHPWQLFVAFYRTKDGQSLMTNPQRSLAQSFSLEIQGGTSKQSLLMAIGNIIVMHRPYKRGPEAHFKAFLSSALNAKKIVPWLRIILRSPTLLDEFYEPWAYVVQPGFDDIWKLLEPLQAVDFRLPEDLSIRSLRNIFDAF